MIKKTEKKTYRRTYNIAVPGFSSCHQYQRREHTKPFHQPTILFKRQNNDRKLIEKNRYISWGRMLGIKSGPYILFVFITLNLSQRYDLRPKTAKKVKCSVIWSFEDNKVLTWVLTVSSISNKCSFQGQALRFINKSKSINVN